MKFIWLHSFDKTWPSLQKINLYFAKYSCKCLSTWYYFTFFDFRHFISFYEKSENSSVTKCQLILKCPFGIIVWTKIPTKLFLDFCPEFFCTFLGAFWKLFGASCRLPYVYGITYYVSPQEAQKASRKPPGSYKKIQGRNPEIISLVFLSKQ